jgi:hypothetical protein
MCDPRLLSPGDSTPFGIVAAVSLTAVRIEGREGPAAWVPFQSFPTDAAPIEPLVRFG